MAEVTLPPLVERVVIEKFDGDPPTVAQPKRPVEVVVMARQGDTVTVTRSAPEE